MTYAVAKAMTVFSVFSAVNVDYFNPGRRFAPVTSAPGPSVITAVLSNVRPMGLLPFSSGIVMRGANGFMFSFTTGATTLTSCGSVVISVVVGFTPSFSPYVTYLLGVSCTLSGLGMPVNSGVSPVKPGSETAGLNLSLSSSSVTFLTVFVTLSAASSAMCPGLSGLDSLTPGMLIIVAFRPTSGCGLYVSVDLSKFFGPGASKFSPV